ncbi:MAG: glycosyltransferase [Bacteroidetes bacterium]|nr:glycosyltransferase [Bacteroidota bacterium]
MKYKLLILGKLPPPYMGPSIAFQILINSELKNNFILDYLDVTANQNLNTLGKWSVKKIATNFSIYSRLIKKLAKVQPDIVLIPVSQTTLGFFKDSIFIILCYIYRRRVIIQLRGSGFKTWVQNSGWLNRFFVSQVLKIPKGVIVLGNNLKYLFTDYFPESAIYIVPNGGNYVVPAREYSTTKDVKLIYLANLQPSKGIEDVINAMVHLKKSGTEQFSLTIIGEWRENTTKEKCLNTIEQFKLPVTIYNSGVSKNKFDYLSTSDIFLFTPREPEGHPWVIVEAMAAGLPVISTNQGAIVESVIDEENGYIVPVKSPEEIAKKIKILIENPDLRIKMGKLSRQMYLSKFTENQMVENYTRAFTTVIENN